MSTKKLQILGSLGEKIYKQNEEPVDAPDGALWVDMDAESTMSGGSSDGLQLNFCVVGSVTEPESPTENMIWINTDVEITDVVFNALQPVSPIDGMIWIMTGSFSYVPFNAVKINNIYLEPQYPLDAKQYIDGSWIDVEAVSYQSGIWERWVNGAYLYKFGDEFTDVTRGFDLVQGDGSYMLNSNTKKKDTYLHLQASANTSGCFVTKSKIDISEYTKLCIHVSSTTGQIEFGVNDSKSYPLTSPEASKSISDSGNAEVALPTSGEYYIYVGVYVKTGNKTVTAQIDEIWLEK